MTTKGSGLPLCVWIIGLALTLIAVMVLVALLGEGEEPAYPGEFDEPGPPPIRPAIQVWRGRVRVRAGSRL